MGHSQAKAPLPALKDTVAFNERPVDADIGERFPVYNVDQNMLYNMVQYGAVWDGWMCIYDIRRNRAKYEANHIRSAAWAWDGSDVPGEFQRRIYDETSRVTVALYGEAHDGAAIEKFLEVLVKSDSQPLNIYVLTVPLDRFAEDFPFMMSENEADCTLPTPFLLLPSDGVYPRVFGVESKRFVALKSWLFKALNINYVGNMSGSLQLKQKSSKSGGYVDDMTDVVQVDQKLEKAFHRLYDAYFAKRRKDILLLDSDGHDFSVTLAGWLCVAALPRDSTHQIVRYFEAMRPDVDQYYTTAIESAELFKVVVQRHNENKDKGMDAQEKEQHKHKLEKERNAKAAAKANPKPKQKPLKSKSRSRSMKSRSMK